MHRRHIHSQLEVRALQRVLVIMPPADMAVRKWTFSPKALIGYWVTVRHLQAIKLVFNKGIRVLSHVLGLIR